VGPCGPVIYSAYGSRIDSDIALPVVRQKDCGNVDVRVRFGAVDTHAVAVASLDIGDGLDEAWMERGWHADKPVLIFPELVAELDSARSTIVIDVREAVDDDYLAHVVLDHVLPRWLYLRGDLVLHGGAVLLPSGQAAVFIGRPGQGKSSLVTALGQAGWPVLGDDACRLVRREDTWWAVPSYPGVRLTGSSRAALLPHVSSRPMAEGSDKHRLVPSASAVPCPTSLGVVIELGGSSDAPRVQRMRLSEATASLTRHSFYLADSPAALARVAFNQSSAVAAAVPCLMLSYRRTWDVYPEVISLLEATEASLR
jgi:hypothetical protein